MSQGLIDDIPLPSSSNNRDNQDSYSLQSCKQSHLSHPYSRSQVPSYLYRHLPALVSELSLKGHGVLVPGLEAPVHTVREAQAIGTVIDHLEDRGVRTMKATPVEDLEARTTRVILVEVGTVPQ